MLDSNTLYLLLAMAGFVCIAIVMVHHHNCSDLIRRKKNEVNSVATQLKYKTEALERECIDIQIQIDAIDDEINALKPQM
ncbi:hypothetical protein PSDVSF_06970 [Pseudodesulfovibrio sediminis]|uniref:Phage shock protein B n=2 Tax=Pseudodesulfovibrio sediminis TaxID=2810563 RepID=A0ABM7P3M2_9BACT|nr:hypothetical protein PSDVSF_06970 [Pseudodesulfovibrio sediminis]